MRTDYKGVVVVIIIKSRISNRQIVFSKVPTMRRNKVNQRRRRKEEE